MPDSNTPESQPILEKIRLDLIETVGRISPLTGYTITGIAGEPTRLGTATGSVANVAIDVMLGESDWNRDIQYITCIEWMQEFLFLATYTLPEDTTISADQLAIFVRSDIEKAVDEDPYRGGWAGDTLPNPPTWFNRNSGEHEGVIARRYVRYRTAWENPYIFRA